MVKSLSAIFIFSLVAHAHADSRDNFVQNILPKKYPLLVSYLNDNSKFPVTWLSQTGEQQSQSVELAKDGSIIIKTMMYGGPAMDMSTPVQVTMRDNNQDARLDYIEYRMQGKKPESINKPTDDSSLFLWDTALAITFKYSQCCLK